MATRATATKERSVADPNFAYESIKDTWLRNRAVCSGEKYTKDFDGTLDKINFKNLLIPFSPTMSPEQYNFYKAEAELPGLVSLYLNFIVSGLLRKQPQLKLPDGIAEEVSKWILNEFSQDGLPLASFLCEALHEEVQTARAWIYVDYPVIKDPDSMTREDFAKIKPYPILWKAESIINWATTKDPITGERKLSRIITRGYEEDFSQNEFHPEMVDTVIVHELDKSGLYQIRKFRDTSKTNPPTMVQGKQHTDIRTSNPVFEEYEVNTNILVNGERLKFIPAWPLNGSIDITEPFITALVNREVALYNKVSRRNHLLYGASTYTPVIMSDMADDDFDEIVRSGLGTWIKLAKDDSVTVLNTPTAALIDMDRAIEATIEEMAKMGIRMLSPESSESGIALEIRNAAQTATLGVLNAKVSNIVSAVIAFMIGWRYGIEISPSDIEFSLSADFNPSPLGEGWLRLVTEWYQAGLIPRTVWLQILKQNDIVPADYNDTDAVQEINNDEFIMPSTPGRIVVNAAINGQAQAAAMAAQGYDTQSQSIEES